ncbi:MAG: cytidine deaminase [Christensenellaceae bacterium]|nr:cytidine deaminase [Christensenellaceae bacterium]
MKLLWQIETETAPAWLSLIQTAADAALLTEGVARPCAASIRVCGDEAIREVNRECRGIDRATDVLSFPTVGYPAGTTAGCADKLLLREFDDELNACMLGDLIISVPHVLAQAEEYGHSPEREAAYLTVHGLCHLMGYDHIEEDDRRRMRAMEEKILASIGMDRDESAAVSDETLLALAIQARERSYSPYSGFAVGAALLCEDGRVFQGCNIENASFGLTNCAERTALFKAVSEGAREFTAIAIAAEKAAPWPCGACRQALNEFAPGIRVLVTWDGQTDEKPLSELLPCGFGPKELPKKE